MKQFLSVLLLIAMLLCLVSCGGEPETAEPSPSPDVPTALPAVTQPPYSGDSTPTGETAQAFTGNIGGGEGAIDPSLITAPPLTLATDAPDDLSGETEPTAAPQYDPYTYTTLTNSTLQVKFLYPEGWLSDPTTDTITMVEPVEEGDVPARFSVTSFEYTYSDKEISNRRLKSHLTDFVKKMVSGYNEYQLDSTGYDRSFAQSNAIYVQYIAVKGNSYISGIAMVGYGKNGRVYCMHFCCEKDDFDSFSGLIDTLASHVTPIDS